MADAVRAGTVWSGARSDSVVMCGKTGTSQNKIGKDHSVFVAFAPKDDPKIAIAVYVENAGFGGLVALDVAKRHPALVASLVLADVPLHAFVPAATRAMAEQRSALEAALRAGGRRAVLKGLGVAAVVLTRSGARAHVVAAADALAALMPAVSRVLDGDPVAAAAAA